MNDKKIKNTEEELKKRFEELKEKHQNQEDSVEEDDGKIGILPEKNFKKNMGCGG